MYIKRLTFAMIALSLSLMTISGQGQNDGLSASFSSKAKYAAGKNSYLLDECKVDYTLKEILGNPVYFTNTVWTRKNDFTMKSEKISYSELNAYPDLQKRFELITPVHVTYKFTILFHSNHPKGYIASAKSEIIIPLPEKAGSTADLQIPTTGRWTEMFTDIVVGKQDPKSPGIVIPDESMENYFKIERINYGKLDKDARGFGRSLRQIFAISDRIEISNVEMSVEWNDADYAYIVDEYARRKNASKQPNKQKAESIYYDNRTYKPAISENDPDFWNTTTTPYEIWMNAIDMADKLYAVKKLAEARVYYKDAAEADPQFNYPVRRMEKIQKYLDNKLSRNVGNLELIYVEGSGDMKPFYIGKTEITQSQWRRIMRSNPSGFSGCSDCPVEKVSWEEVQEFLKKLSEQTGMKYRLPRMDEWEYAAKGGNKSMRTRFSGSDNLDEIAWSVYNSEESTHSVAKKAPNELGIYDMTGNVSEWISNMYDKNTRFAKGGSWSDDVTNSTITSSEKYDAKYKNNRIGFRVCQDE